MKLQHSNWRENLAKDFFNKFSTNESTQIYNRSCDLYPGLYLQIPTENHLRLDQAKLCFQMDYETGMPQGYKVYELRNSNRLIEEFMLLANISVANKIHECFPDLAVLRCHPEPKQAILDRSVEFLQRFGIRIDGSTSKYDFFLIEFIYSSTFLRNPAIIQLFLQKFQMG